MQVGVGDRGHADEVVGAAEEGAERGGEGLPAPGLQADGGGDHLLLGDVHLEEAVGVLGGEALGVGRVADLAVERDDLLVDRRRARRGRRRRRRGSRPSRRSRRRGARPARGRSRRTAPRGGFATSTRSERSPPSSSTAASGSSSGLPCWLGWSSTAATPEPFLVRAKITAGRSAVERPRVGARRSPRGRGRRSPARPSRRPRRAPPARRCPTRAWSGRAGRAG